MNYPRNLKKAAIARRIIVSWLIVGLVFSLVGFVLGVITAN